ncbi:MAG TPA: CaiB/BaiF CoA-transferase family protein [Thermoleophilaceae bacterium]|nr:CaiB/BaiF CoA-transferase family protein [Thermoleophilaceae bacterium]
MSALEGVKVLDLTRLLPGPFATMLLADLGADVLKVEDTGMGDYVRWAPPYHEGAAESAKSAQFLALNRGKRSLRLDLKQDVGREVLMRLVEDADVLVEGFRPGVMERLGVGYETLAQRNPGLVFCSITGYGQTGPYTGRSGHDMNYLGLIGLLDLTGEPGGPPVQAGGQIADLGGGGLMAAYSILAALRESERTGRGQALDVSMADGALSWLALSASSYLADGRVPGRGAEGLTGGFVCYRPYACSDGYVTLGALEPKFWAAWCAGVGRDDLMDKAFEPPGSDAHAEVERIFAERTCDEWTAFAGEHDCCLEPVLDVAEALDSDLVREREMVVEVDQPGARKPVRALGHPVKFSGTPADTARQAPALGEHTAEVLAGLGYSDEQAAALAESGAVAGPPDAATGSFMS